MIQAGLGFFASVAARRSQSLVNRSRRFPFRILLQESRGIKYSLVVPEEFASPIWAGFVLQDFVKRLERAGAVVFLFQTEGLFKQRLVAPVNRSVLLRRQLVINFDGLLVICASAHFEKNIAFTAQRLALLRLRSIAFQHFII